ncbi:MAG: hypothetical protein JO306_08995 [Gemmatimonadetes bacterium]|nr:hypothetical protein [Gemmatimonadota bacterium]
MGIAAALWALGGWCGSVPISVIIAWIIRHHGVPPLPEPPPYPWQLQGLVARVLGIVGGVAGGYLAGRVGTVPDTAPALTAVSFLAAVAGGFFLADLYAAAVVRAPAASRAAAPAASLR